MDRKEKRLVVFLVLFILLQIPLFYFTNLVHYLNSAEWFIVGGNLIQWSSLFSTEAAIIAAIWMYWHRRCEIKFCFRMGEHEVDSTTYKTCKKHHQIKYHEQLYDQHQRKHPHLLGWGESHKKDKK